jgi:hypothetical protein
MRYKIAAVGDYLRVEIFDRKTVEEAQQIIRAVSAESQKTRSMKILVWVRNSLPIFKVEKYGLSEHLKRLAGTPAVRVALLADAEDLRSAHQYVEVLARQQGVNLRSFRDEPSALAWLRDEAEPPRGSA